MPIQHSVNTKPLHFNISGQGPVIVLLHGFLESGEIWKKFARRLSLSFQVVVIDLPGHGSSSGNFERTVSMDEMAEAVHYVLASRKITRCIMAGHSMGGYVTLAFAEKYPRMLKGFILFHSHAAADSPEARANRERALKLAEKDHHGFIKNFIPDLFAPKNVSRFGKEIQTLRDMAMKTEKAGIIAALEGMKIRPDRQHVLLHTKVPVLFIIGKNDRRMPMEMIMPQTLLPSHCEVLLLDNVGHMGFLEASGPTFSALKGFAERFT
jgi:pimeloyl-ACP methyl ester carboxylesterase